MITFQSIEEVKTVNKPWGWEKWIQAGSDQYPFVLKQLCLKADQRTSLQVHKVKSESIIILQGQGILMTCDQDFDCDAYLNNQYSQQELEQILNSLRSITIGPGAVFHTPPGTIHRMVALTDLVYVEASTQELDDVIRLQDDQNRTHGRINNEHQ